MSRSRLRGSRSPMRRSCASSGCGSGRSSSYGGGVASSVHGYAAAVGAGQRNTTRTASEGDLRVDPDTEKSSLQTT
ncbi:unnamed protein product [Ectocarpus sp. 8 AP-2014]